MEPEALVKHHMARSFYAQDWADWADRAGFRYGQVMDHIPQVSPEPYHALATAALTQLEKSTKLTLTQVIAVLAAADGVEPDEDWLTDLGHDLGMMATGSGVSWFDDHERPDGLDIDMYVTNDGIGWDQPNEWYSVPVVSYRFKAGTYDDIYKFSATAAGDYALATILDEYKSNWPDLPLSSYTFERLA